MSWKKAFTNWSNLEYVVARYAIDKLRVGGGLGPIRKGLADLAELERFSDILAVRIEREQDDRNLPNLRAHGRANDAEILRIKNNVALEIRAKIFVVMFVVAVMLILVGACLFSAAQPLWQTPGA